MLSKGKLFVGAVAVTSCPVKLLMCLPSQETNGWCEENTYERLRKALVDLTKKTAERSKLNWVEAKANPGRQSFQCSSHYATTVAHMVAGAYEDCNAPGSTDW